MRSLACLALAAVLLTGNLLPAASAAWAEPIRRPNASQLEAIRRWLCPNGGTPVRGRPGRCDGAGGGSFGTPGWDRDLPPPTRQARVECPAGTRPVQARARQDVIRCLPD
ncbi:hypothetical protein BKE38_04390 [Pseudoroseomonas deserti]|uniref:Secreted protein n=1 Tax=Teichococcus deserti TaxID=1817963 RepID=A0A1V2H6L3_9PROT|nr:hypothetical protein [Pseudoroseomonas deserti]ONG57292.1 hypothetical protein BKE38_04390 [Pseudoroseomonas deserti]